MRKPVIATSLSAIGIFMAGLVAGQLGSLPLGFAASKPGVGANAGVAPGANANVTTYRNALNQSSIAKSAKAGARPISSGNLSSSEITLPATNTMSGRDPRLFPGGPRGPTGGAR